MPGINSISAMALRGATVGIPVGILAHVYKRYLGYKNNIESTATQEVSLPLIEEHKRRKKAGVVSNLLIRSGLKTPPMNFMQRLAIRLGIKDAPTTIQGRALSRVQSSTPVELAAAGAGVGVGAYGAKQLWDVSEKHVLNYKLKRREQELDQALMNEQLQRLKFGSEKEAVNSLLVAKVGDVYNRLKSSYSGLPDKTRVLLASLGLGSGLLIGKQTYDQVRSSDKDAVIKKLIAKNMQKRLASAPGFTIGLAGTGSQPFRRGARALVDPGAGRDVLDDL